MSAFSFSNLDLSSVQASKPRFAVGRHLVTIRNAEVKATSTGGHQLVVTIGNAEGAELRDYINVHVPSSAEAQQYGLQRLKQILIGIKHPNPDKPGDVATMKGKKIGVMIGSEEYVKDGERKTGVKVKFYIDPSELSEKPVQALVDMPDDIPF